MSDSVWPHRRQPTRLPCPWDSLGKNTGVGCHFLLQCMKVKSESEVTESCPTLGDPMDCSPPGSSIHGIFQARVLEWGAIAELSKIYRLQHTTTKNNKGLKIYWHIRISSLNKWNFGWRLRTSQFNKSRRGLGGEMREIERKIIQGKWELAEDPGCNEVDYIHVPERVTV